MPKMKIDGPIPGENFTSNTKNYPWHRPPETADFIEVVEKAVKKFSQPQGIGMIKTMLASGDSIVDILVGNLRIDISRGKMPIDAAILAAGPLSKLIEVIAEKSGVDYERGWSEAVIPTVAEMEGVYGLNQSKYAPKNAAPAQEPEPPQNGLMTPTDDPVSERKQAAMLGYDNEE